jgi:lipoprotein-anchoring transpeptidase ErfK/SrfK
MTRPPATFLSALAALALVAGCGFGDEAPREDAPDDVTAEPARARARAGTDAPATALASGRAELSPDEIEAGRLDSDWRRYAEEEARRSPAAPAADSAARTGMSTADTAAAGDRDSAAGDTTAAPGDSAAWSDISRQSVNAAVAGLPLHGDVEGPAVAKVQILLDQARFSPGIIDGRWGKNTEKAVFWFQKAHGIEPTGQVDRRTLEALQQRGGGQQVRSRRLTEADVTGPFQQLPEDVYERAEQPCLCYESLREKLSEVFHATPELLEQLNPGVDLDAVSAGDNLDVPAVDPFHMDNLPDGQYTGGGDVARIVVSDGGHYVHALDQAGNILYHFPSTLGSDYAPSPSGDFSVRSISFDPTWHYQPDLLTGVDPSEEDAVLPAGPNNAVGIVWMQLSKDHYGIHGTAAPETIGYATSHGCVRLTNWDAGFLGQRIPPGVPVEFTSVAGNRQGGA